MAMSGNDDSVTIPKLDQPEVPSSQPIEKYAWVESQQSMDKARARPRKASFVMQPIFQSAKRQKTVKENVQAGGNRSTAGAVKKGKRTTRAAAAKGDNIKSKFNMMQ